MVHADLILIGDGEKVLGCEGVSLKTQATWLGQGLVLAYGEQVRIAFLDINKDKEDPLVMRVKTEKRKFPLLLVNGEVRYEAGLPLTALKALLEGMGIKPLHPIDVQK